MAEKDIEYNVGGANGDSPSPDPYYVSAENKIEARRGSKVNEATDVFGDVQTAEEYGYVSRGLKSRHIQFIALGRLHSPFCADSPY